MKKIETIVLCKETFGECNVFTGVCVSNRGGGVPTGGCGFWEGMSASIQMWGGLNKRQVFFILVSLPYSLINEDYINFIFSNHLKLLQIICLLNISSLNKQLKFYLFSGFGLHGKTFVKSEVQKK